MLYQDFIVKDLNEEVKRLNQEIIDLNSIVRQKD